MASLIYDSFRKKIQDGSIDLDTDTMKVALVTSSYSPSQTTHTWFADITNEITGTGYSAGGVALANKTCTTDTSNHRGVFDADDVSWSASTLTARAAIIYKSTGNNNTSPLVAYVDFGGDVSSASSTLTVVWDTVGILYLA